MAVEFASFNTKRPEEPVQTDTQNTETKVEQGGGDVTKPVDQTTQTTPESQPKTETPPKGDEFIETFNKKFGVTYKGEDDIKGLFELTKKVTEYEGKLKESETYKSQADNYKKELEELKNQSYSEFLSKPLIKKAYVAQQLLEKYPDKDPFVLQEIAMTEVDKMDDLDVVAKERKVRYPTVKLENLKAIILNELGIDAAVAPEEWDSMAKDKLTMMAGDARQRIKEMTNGIEIPKFQTKEEREKLYNEAMEQKVKLTAPIRDKFCQFDEYINGDFKFAVPNEFKEKLGDVFQGMFIDAGLEVNEENLGIAEALKESMFIKEYFPKIKEVIEKQAQTIVQAKVDEELNNTSTPNTSTATDTKTLEELPGVSKFLQDQKSELSKKL